MAQNRLNSTVILVIMLVPLSPLISAGAEIAEVDGPAVYVDSDVYSWIVPELASLSWNSRWEVGRSGVAVSGMAEGHAWLAVRNSMGEFQWNRSFSTRVNGELNPNSSWSVIQRIEWSDERLLIGLSFSSYSQPLEAADLILEFGDSILIDERSSTNEMTLILELESWTGEPIRQSLFKDPGFDLNWMIPYGENHTLVAMQHYFRHWTSPHIIAWGGGADQNYSTWDIGGRIYESDHRQAVFVLIDGEGVATDHLMVSSGNRIPSFANPEPDGDVVRFLVMSYQPEHECRWNTASNTGAIECVRGGPMTGSYSRELGFVLVPSTQPSTEHPSSDLRLMGGSFVHAFAQNPEPNVTVLQIDISHAGEQFHSYARYEVDGEVGEWWFINATDGASIVYLDCSSPQCTLDGSFSVGNGQRVIFDPDSTGNGSLVELNPIGDLRNGLSFVELLGYSEIEAHRVVMLITAKDGDGREHRLLTDFALELIVMDGGVDGVANDSADRDVPEASLESAEDDGSEADEREGGDVRSKELSRPVAYLWIGFWSLVLSMLMLIAIKKEP